MMNRQCAPVIGNWVLDMDVLRRAIIYSSPFLQLEIDLDQFIHRTGYVWHIELESVGSYTRYGYRCKVHGH